MNAAWRRLLERHEALRCRFTHLPGMVMPLQTVDAQPVGDLRVIEATGLSAAQRANELSRQLEELAAVPLEFERGPLLRAALSVR